MNKHGLTPENLLVSLPQALQGDDSIVALAQAISSVLSGRIEEINHLRIYPAIDQLDEPLLDILAHDFKVDWWDADYALEEKRRTLKDSWRVHKLMGTKAAVETAISAIYPNTKVLEWFEYGGSPVGSPAPGVGAAELLQKSALSFRRSQIFYESCYRNLLRLRENGWMLCAGNNYNRNAGGRPAKIHTQHRCRRPCGWHADRDSSDYPG